MNVFAKIPSAAAWIGGLVLHAAVVPAALAQEANEASGDKASWAMSYLLMILLIALGLIAVCRPGSRSSELDLKED